MSKISSPYIKRVCVCVFIFKSQFLSTKTNNVSIYNIFLRRKKNEVEWHGVYRLNPRISLQLNNGFFSLQVKTVCLSREIVSFFLHINNPRALLPHFLLLVFTFQLILKQI